MNKTTTTLNIPMPARSENPPQAQWKEARSVFPIYLALAKQLEIEVPFTQAKRSLPEKPDHEIFSQVHEWLDAMDQRVLVHQLRHLLQMTTLNASETGLRALIQRHLRKAKIPYGIATSGKRADIKNSLKALALKSDVVVIDGDMVREVKPEPDLFLLCQQTLKVEPADCLIVGDAVWDIYAARRSGIMSAGLLSGGFGEQELYNAGAMRVYRDASALLEGINELGFK